MMLRAATALLLSMLFLLPPLSAQDLSRWYNMDTQVIDKGWCVYNSDLLNQHDSTYLAWETIPSDLTNVQVSYITLSNSAVDDLHLMRSRVYGLRAKLNGKEILLVDTDLDLRFDDEQIQELPALELSDQIEYNDIYQYPTEVNFSFPMEYDFLVNNQIHAKASNLGFSVLSKYDPASKSLYYLDKFKLCFNQRLIYQGDMDGEVVKLRCYDFLPWVKSILFRIKIGDLEKEIGIKDLFVIPSTGQQYQIDSVDFVNNKVLISKSLKKQQLVLTGESLMDSSMESTSGTSENLRIVHVWGSWCVPCIRNMPKLVQFQKDFDNVEMIGICVDKDKAQALKAAHDHQITWRNLFFDLREFKTGNTLNIAAYPTYFLVDTNDEILGKFLSFEKVKEAIEKRMR